MKTTGGTIQLAKGTRFILGKTKQLFKKFTGLDQKQITFHPKLPLHQRTFHQPRIIEDYEFPEFNYKATFSYWRNRQEGWAMVLFIICFGAADFVTRIAKDQGFGHKYYLRYPQLLYSIDGFLDKIGKTRDKYLSYIGETKLTNYDYNIKKEEAMDMITNKKERQVRRAQEEEEKKRVLILADKYVNKFQQLIEGKNQQ